VMSLSGHRTPDAARGLRHQIEEPAICHVPIVFDLPPCGVSLALTCLCRLKVSALAKVHDVAERRAQIK
jgi:hypothetical protein